MTQLWLKHRPSTLTNMVGLDALKADAGSWSVAGTLRCGGVIFHGPPGTGKTTAARAIAKDMLNDAFEANFHEFNASDERGIAFVRDRLKPLAEQKAVGATFKVINLDEADGLTRDAQDTMRQVIELTSPHTLWILTCNRVSRIIPALRSRLPSYTFPPLGVEEADAFLSVVVHEEGFPDQWTDAIPALIKKHHGDLRACLKTLQVCNPDSPDSLLGVIHDDLQVVEGLYDAISEGECEGSLRISTEVINQGIGRDEIIDSIHRSILKTYEQGGHVSVALKHLLILGQWSARSPDWTAGDLLFLQSLIGDYQNRG